MTATLVEAPLIEAPLIEAPVVATTLFEAEIGVAESGVTESGVTVPDGVRARVMALLAGGVPLSLLMDLADPDGPDSLAVMRHERQRSVVGVPDLD